MEIHLVQNRKENCRHDHIPFNLKGKANIVFSVCGSDGTSGKQDICTLPPRNLARLCLKLLALTSAHLADLLSALYLLVLHITY